MFNLSCNNLNSIETSADLLNESKPTLEYFLILSIDFLTGISSFGADITRRVLEIARTKIISIKEKPDSF